MTTASTGRWNIDKEVLRMEPSTIPGTSINRVLVATSVMEKHGVKVTPAQRAKGHGIVWSIGFGVLGEPRVFFLGQTIREAFLRARRAWKSGKLRSPDVTPPPRAKKREPGRQKRVDPV